MKPALKVLLVDDNLADVDLVRSLLAEGPHGVLVSTTKDGEEAMAFLQRSGRFNGATRPDLVVLDLHMPRKDGRAVLAEVRADASLRTLPVVVFTTSQAEHDIRSSYELGANCYLSKPGNLKDFCAAVRSFEEFWFSFASLPHKERT